MAVTYKIDMRSRGEVARQLRKRLDAGLVKDCRNLRLDHNPAGFEPVCEIDWASKDKDAKLEATLVSAYGGSYQANWPRCPQDCPHYRAVEGDFSKSAGRDQYETPERPAPMAPAPEAAAPAVMIKTPIRVAEPPGETTAASRVERNTVRWLLDNIGLDVWALFVTALASAFVLGVNATRVPWVREVFGLPTVAESATSKLAPPVAAPSSPTKDSTKAP